MSYVIYLRKSRADMEEEAKGKGETLARHQTILLEFAKSHQYDVTAIYKELVSGDTIAARPEMQKLISEVSAGMWEGVICMEVERLARGDTIDQGIVAQAFKYSNTKIITPYKTYDPSNEFDETFFEFNLFMARQEYKTIRRRMQAGRLQSVKEGNFIQPDAPYGYRVVHRGKRDNILEIVPEQAVIVKRIFEMYAEGKGYGSISNTLNREGVFHTDKAPNWTRETISYILRNPSYVGKVRWGYRPEIKTISSDGRKKKKFPVVSDAPVYEGKHEPIISEELYEKVHNILLQNTRIPIKADHNVRNPLAGILKCGACEKSMVLVKNHGRYSLRCPTQTCHENMLCLYTDVEEIVLSALRDKYNDLINVKNQSRKQSDTSTEDRIRKQAENELKKITSQKNKLYDLLEQGIYSTDLFTERLSKLTVKEKELNNIINSAPPVLSNSDLQEAKGNINIILNQYDILSEYEKNLLFKSVIKRILYHKTGERLKANLWLEIEYLI